MSQITLILGGVPGITSFIFDMTRYTLKLSYQCASFYVLQKRYPQHSGAIPGGSPTMVSTSSLPQLPFYSVDNGIYFPSEFIAVHISVFSTMYIVQLIYAWRLWIISLQRNIWLPSLVAFFATVTYSITIWAIGSVWVASGIQFMRGFFSIADLFISGGLFYYLDIKLRTTSQIKTYFRRLRVIIVRTVECNLWSLFSQLGLVILFVRNVGLYHCEYQNFLNILNMVLWWKSGIREYYWKVNARLNNDSSVWFHVNPDGGCMVIDCEVESLPLSVILGEGRPESNSTPKHIGLRNGKMNYFLSLLLTKLWTVLALVNIGSKIIKNVLQKLKIVLSEVYKVIINR
ncbi:hypothetical protein K435DRAFT_807375 [Dendrothele bispora CBS 962.96]|uniref:Uncharacterized protein n=1 Tax=Dendrothele bispora (strain CBS 962.96) TaxID=1314807 RepID=A0A4S8L4Y3_DENBC|nr:hypothetical protein K435DRAFT_807375 [Dendrothele bispora CBS 962.96]